MTTDVGRCHETAHQPHQLRTGPRNRYILSTERRLFASDVNKDLTCKAKAKVKDQTGKDKAKAKDLSVTAKAKAKDLVPKAKAKDLTDLVVKDSAKDSRMNYMLSSSNVV